MSNQHHRKFWMPLVALFACVTANANEVNEDKVSAEQIFRIDPSVLESSARKAVVDVPPVMRVIEPQDATASAVMQFAGSEGRFHVGVASYDEVTLELRDWPFDEFMYFLEGDLELTSEAGEVTRVSAGDVIVVPKGFNGTWRQLTPIKKVSVLYDGGGFYDRRSK